MPTLDDGPCAARAYPRIKLFQPAEMLGHGAASRVHLLNISAGGAKLHASAPPPAATPIVIRCGSLRRSARVAWVDGPAFGAAFTVPLTEPEIAALLNHGAPA